MSNSAFADEVTKNVVIEGINITLKKISLGDQLDVSRRFRDEGDAGATMAMLVSSIVGWDIKTKDGSKILDINAENIRRLRFDLINKLTAAISDFNHLSEQEIKNL